MNWKTETNLIANKTLINDKTSIIQQYLWKIWRIKKNRSGWFGLAIKKKKKPFAFLAKLTLPKGLSIMGPVTTKFKLTAILLVVLAAQFTHTIAADDIEGGKFRSVESKQKNKIIVEEKERASF